MTEDEKVAFDYAAGALPTHAHLQGAVAQAFIDGRNREHAEVERRDALFVETLMPHDRERGMVVCLVCGGEGLGGASVMHRDDCALVALVVAWGWERPLTAGPSRFEEVNGTCRLKMCTSTAGACGSVAVADHHR